MHSINISGGVHVQWSGNVGLRVLGWVNVGQKVSRGSPPKAKPPNPSSPSSIVHLSSIFRLPSSSHLPPSPPLCSVPGSPSLTSSCLRHPAHQLIKALPPRPSIRPDHPPATLSSPPSTTRSPESTTSIVYVFVPRRRYPAPPPSPSDVSHIAETASEPATHKRLILPEPT
jgi:hypothetical protein